MQNHYNRRIMFHAMNECSYQSFTLSSQTTTLTTNYGIIPTWSVSLILAAVCSCWPPRRHWWWWRDGDATMACVLTRYNYEIRSRRRWRYCWLDVVYSAATCRMTGERRRVHTFLSSIIQTSSDPIKHSTTLLSSLFLHSLRSIQALFLGLDTFGNIVCVNFDNL